MKFLKTVALLAAMGVGMSAQARDFRTSDIYPPESPTVQALAQMGLIVERQSYSRLKIKPPTVGDRDSENFTIAQVRNGSLDMARVTLAALNVAVPSTALLSAPYLLRSPLQAQRVLEGPIGAEILADLEQHDLIGLCFYDAGARSIYTIDKPVRTLADVKGLRIRAQPGDIASNFWQHFGAVPLAMPYSRVSDGLRTHALDGATGNWQSFVFGEHYKAVKYLTLTEHARPPGVVIFSRQVWKSLPEVDRTILAAAAKESAIHQRQLLEAFEAQARRTVEAAGVKIVDDADLKSFREPMEQLYEKLYPDPKQRAQLKRIQAAATGS